MKPWARQWPRGPTGSWPNIRDFQLIFVLFASRSTRGHQAPHFIAGAPCFDLPSAMNSADFDAFRRIGLLEFGRLIPLLRILQAVELYDDKATRRVTFKVRWLSSANKIAAAVGLQRCRYLRPMFLGEGFDIVYGFDRYNECIERPADFGIQQSTLIFAGHRLHANLVSDNCAQICPLVSRSEP